LIEELREWYLFIMNAKELGSRLLAEVEETNLHEVGEAQSSRQ